MAKLTSTKLGDWELPHVHMWKDRAAEIRGPRVPLIGRSTRVVTIGSCFAQELAASMERRGLAGSMHPVGLFYTTRSVRQEFDRIFNNWKGYEAEPFWKTARGYVHPFKDYHRTFETLEAMRAWSEPLDRRADELFTQAEVIVITLGLIEAWRNPKTGNYYRTIPPPDVFDTLGAEFHRLTVGEMLEDLVAIRETIRRCTKAQIVITVSPIPLHATLTPHDVRVANAESKSRIRAAVSELVERFSDVHYFHSYEIVTTAERASDFMREDGRHVTRQGVDYIIHQFLEGYAAEESMRPGPIDTSWLTAPSKTAAKAAPDPAFLPPAAARMVERLKPTIRTLLARVRAP